MPLKIAIRTDASPTLGLGHLMRCLTLADALAARGSAVRFLCRPLASEVAALVTGRGHALTVLEAADDEGEGGETGDCRASLAALDEDVDWLVVDHYGLGAAWEEGMRVRARAVMAIDDLPDRSHACDLFLDQNASAGEDAAQRVPASCRCLLGPRYALLRPQFAAARATLPPRDGKVGRLLVFYGGADAGGETVKALQGLTPLSRDTLDVDVVIGAANPHRRAIEALMETIPRGRLFVQADDMAGLMARAHLCLGAGGSTSLERCCLGLPTLVTALAENQETPARALAMSGCQIYLGRAEDLTAADYTALLDQVTGLPECLAHMAKQGMELVDGRGARRVASQLLGSGIALRPAEPGDRERVLAWRNHPDVRRHSFGDKPIDPATHAAWYAASLANPDRVMLIGELEGEPIGVLRYDLDSGQAMVSVYLAPGLTGHGLGGRLLRAGEDWLARERPHVTRLLAEVRADNAASLGAFGSAGFDQYNVVLGKMVHGHE